MTLTFHVPGRAVPMGSRSAVQRRGGKAWTFPQQSKALRAWQHSVACAARLARPDGWPTAAAYRVYASVRFAAPKSDPRRGGPHTAKPDGDKLLRAILDALTRAGIWRDDAQAFDARCSKWWSVGDSAATITVEACDWRTDERDSPDAHAATPPARASATGEHIANRRNRPRAAGQAMSLTPAQRSADRALCRMWREADDIGLAMAEDPSALAPILEALDRALDWGEAQERRAVEAEEYARTLARTLAAEAMRGAERIEEVARLRALLARVPHLESSGNIVGDDNPATLRRIVSTHDFHTETIAAYRAECARLGGACANEGSER